jgi:hypothetical protein
MVKRALCVALGLVGVCFPAMAQQMARPEWPVGAFDPMFALDLYQPRISAADNFLLFHRGRVTPWADGGWLANKNAMSQIGMASVDFSPVGFIPPDTFGTYAAPGGNVGSRSGKSRTDGKDTSGDLAALQSNHVYYGGEVGFLYGQSSGKGGGSMWETYVNGTVGNDKFQISAGAAFDEWNGNGRSVRFRSFAAPR